ncbi:hypothetical protein AMJ96_CH02675 [Rhizobium sp. N113]|nr:hypothetical protein AMJ98_CH02671 [Rhizobium sp. N1341]ANL22372.1 hypothetical protein AMJ96_CH02675 [Rhizobium sp. N113]ANM41087.1 hypothetical protein AMK03_CH02592 [Rhizobium sp. N741]
MPKLIRGTRRLYADAHRYTETNEGRGDRNVRSAAGSQKRAHQPMLPDSTAADYSLPFISAKATQSDYAMNGSPFHLGRNANWAAFAQVTTFMVVTCENNDRQDRSGPRQDAAVMLIRVGACCPPRGRLPYLLNSPPRPGCFYRLLTRLLPALRPASSAFFPGFEGGITQDRGKVLDGYYQHTGAINLDRSWNSFQSLQRDPKKTRAGFPQAQGRASDFDQGSSF